MRNYLERAAPTPIAVNPNPPVVTAVAPRVRSPAIRNRNPISESEIRAIREHAKTFLQECCTLDLRASEHTVNLQTAWANYLVAHGISPQNKWQYFKTIILASHVTKASSSFTDIRNPRKPRTKGYCGIKLRGDIYAAAVELA